MENGPDGPTLGVMVPHSQTYEPHLNDRTYDPSQVRHINSSATPGLESRDPSRVDHIIAAINRISEYAREQEQTPTPHNRYLDDLTDISGVTPEPSRNLSSNQDAFLNEVNHLLNDDRNPAEITAEIRANQIRSLGGSVERRSETSRYPSSTPSNPTASNLSQQNSHEPHSRT